MAHGVERRPRCISTGARPRRHWAARCLGGLAIAGLLAASAPLGADEGKPKTTEDLLAELLKQTQAQNELLAKQAKQIEDLQKKVNDVLMRASPPGAPGGAMGAIPHVDPPVSRASAVPLREAPLAPVGPATASGLPGLVGYPRTATREGYIATETYGRSYSPSNSAYLTRPTDSERGAQMEALDVDLMTSRAHSVDGMGRVSAPGFFTQRQVRVVRDGRSVKYLPVEPDEYGWAAASGGGTPIPDWLHLPEPKTKLALCFSGARNADLARLNEGDTDIQRKGFTVPTARLDTQFQLGSALGSIGAQYYKDRGGNQDDLDVNEAFADFHVPMARTASIARPKETVGMEDHDRVFLRLGKASAPFGLYGDSKWPDWAWLETPLIFGRLLPNHLNSLGVSVDLRLTDPRGPFDSVVSASILNAYGDDMKSFMGGSIAGHARSSKENRFALGDLVAAMRWNNAISLCPKHLVVHVGAEAAHGPNGAGQAGDTWMYGAYGRLFMLGYERCGKPSGLVLEAEWMERQAFLDTVVTSSGTFPRANLTDTGFYGSLVYTMAEHECLGILSFGVKYESVYGRGANFDATSGARTPRHAELSRCDRDRWSGLVSWQPATALPILGRFSLTAEYLFDDADALNDTEHTVVLGIQVR